MTNGPEERWKALWSRIAPVGDGRSEFDDICRRYAEPHRAYHTLAHIDHCLTEFEAARSLARTPDAVEWALWYHDAVYDTHASDNEERSAALALQVAARGSVDADLAAQAGRHILASKHREPPSDPDAQLFVDVDLAILGQSWDRFSLYEEQIRKEYEWVPAWLFKRKRAGLLKAFLKRPNLYGTSFFRKQYESRARQNIVRSLGLSR